MTEESRRTHHGNRIWVILFAVISITVLAGGYGYYRAEEERISRENFREIAAIAELKEGQIRQWRTERMADVRRPTESPFFRREMQEWQRTGFSSGRRVEFRERLKMEQSGGFDDALLLSPDGKILLSATDTPDPVAPATMRAVTASLAGREAVLSDFYLCPLGRVHIDAVAPVLDNARKPLAVLVQRSAAATYLYPLIQTWPIPSKSAESLLVRREGDGILFLNEPRHRAASALSFRFPLSQTNLPAVQAVLGRQGLFRGKDYRGVEVLADLRPVAGSPWFLVAKVDTDEILAEARYRAGVIALFTGCLILLAGVMIAYAYRRRQAGIYLELYRAEREQREAREEFRTTLYSIGDAVISTDNNGRVRQMNPVAEQLTGWSEAEARGKPLHEVFYIINEGTRAAMESPVEMVLRAGQVVGLANHTILIARDGTERPIDDSGAPIRDESGAVSGVVLVFRDVSERKKAELALKESSEFLKTLLNAIPAPIFYKDTEGHYLGINKSFEEFYGLTYQELAGKSVFDIAPRELAEVYHAKDSELLRQPGSQVYESRVKDARGVVHDVIFHKAAFTDSFSHVRGLIGVILDITDLKKAEEALRESEDHVRAKLNSILLPEGDIGILDLADIIDADTIQALMNDFFALTNIGIGIIDLHGKVLVGTGWQDICVKFHRAHPETCRHCLESDTLLSAGVEPGAFRSYRCKNNMWDIVTPITLGGKHVGNLFLGQFLFTDEQPDYDFFRAQAQKYGFDEKEYLAALERVPRWSRETVNRIMTFYARFAQLISGLSYANIKLARTLADREKIEAQLIQAQKMEAVGRLAGGVAHDFNNMLNVILGYAEMSLLKLEPASPILAYLKEISKAGLRSAALTRQLLAFARKQTIAPKVLDLNDTVAGMLKMLMRLIGEDIDLLWKPADALWPVNLDPAQIDQILANLVVNARDAISGVGRITIETGTADFDQAYSDRNDGFIPGQYVLLAVSDDGCGMDKKTLARIFEPFFTTKEVGKGTGLGLATVYGIVKQNSGFINVYSEPGTGTTFRIYLPRYESEPAVADEMRKAVEAPTGTETVLLVEDEDSLLDLGTLLLEDIGYTVLAASCPNRAIRISEEFPGEIHLLLTDVIMPEMSGRDLRERLAASRPNLKSLFMSGYTAEVIAHHGALHEGVHFLQKPFSVQDLAVKLREALNG
jgi:polar amino acid transport system substrate-binding protein